MKNIESPEFDKLLVAYAISFNSSIGELSTDALTDHIEAYVTKRIAASQPSAAPSGKPDAVDAVVAILESRGMLRDLTGKGLQILRDDVAGALASALSEQAAKDEHRIDLIENIIAESGYCYLHKNSARFELIGLGLIGQTLREALDALAMRRAALASPALPEPAAVQEALKLAKAALEHSRPLAHHYPEPVQRHSDALVAVNAALAALASPQPLAEVSAAQTVPEGFVLVPVEPTTEMLKACDTVIQGYGAKLVYQRMLAAAPQPTDTTREA
jgi:hypothetical protein